MYPLSVSVKLRPRVLLISSAFTGSSFVDSISSRLSTGRLANSSGLLTAIAFGSASLS